MPAIETTSRAVPERLRSDVPKSDNDARLRAKTRLFIGIVLVANISGNSALAYGMHRLGDVGNSPLAMIGALFHPWVAIGVALLIVWTFTSMALLSWADLSYVIPVTSIGYVLTALSGKFFLQEKIPLEHWLGILLITAGVMLVGATRPATSEPESLKTEDPVPEEISA